VPSKRRQDDDESMLDDDEKESVKDEDADEDGEEETEAETLNLEQAEEEEAEEEEEDEDDEEFVEATVEDLARRRIFQTEAEETLESITLEEVKDVLKERGMEMSLASRLKKFLSEVIGDGEMESWEEAWQEAINRLEEEIG
jgi:hypothetical protein